VKETDGLFDLLQTNVMCMMPPLTGQMTGNDTLNDAHNLPLTTVCPYHETYGVLGILSDFIIHM